MKLAILYTSFRQFRELDFLPEMFRRLPRLSATARVIYHGNNGAISRTALEEKLAKIPGQGVELIYAPQKNQGGYPYGQFEAIGDAWDRLGEFDWVIHLHPDVFIIDEKPLLAALEKADAEKADIVVTPTFGLNQPSFATDFFAFRPATVPRAIFSAHEVLAGTSIVVLLENLFYLEVHRARLRYSVATRFAHGHYHRDIDRLGLWHEHDLRRVEAYFTGSGSRWLPTWEHCLRRPYMTTRFILNWSGRKLKGIPQESLAQQLTAL